MLEPFSLTPKVHTAAPARVRLREPLAADAPHLARIRTLCAKWSRDPEDFTTRYLNLTARSEFFRQHPDRALAVFESKYLCANPIDGRTTESAEVAPDNHEYDAELPLMQVLGKAMHSLDRPPPKPLLEPCSILALKAAFIAQRGARRMTHSDIAGIVGLSKAAISKAENPKTAPWATFFQSQRVIDAYAGIGSPEARALEKKAYAAFYPRGITTLPELVKYVAYRRDDSIDKMGTDIGIMYLSQKINPKGTSVLGIDEQIALRRHLHAQILPLCHLGLTAELLDELLPSPQVIKAEESSFAETLDRWAVLACGGKGAFVSDVAAYQGRTLAHNSIHYWGAGRGLSANLEPIIAVLKSKPNTKDVFPDHEQAFREAAQAVMKKPRRRGEIALTPSHLERVQQQEFSATENSLSR